MNPWTFSIINVWALVSFVYLLSRLLKRNDLMDIFWGIGFSSIAIVAYLNFSNLQQYNTTKILMMLLVFIWSLRLSLHIIIKNWGKPEDFRYANWRKEWGKTEWWRTYLQINLLQGIFMFIIALPIIAFISSSNAASPLFLIIGSVTSISGLLIESIADFQKSQFKKRNKIGIMKTGLWKYSRHPNYFGEVIFWWGIAIYSFAAVSPIYGLISAITITYLLRYVSGVPMLEKAKEGNTEYEDYQKTTPVFVPFLKP